MFLTLFKLVIGVALILELVTIDLKIIIKIFTYPLNLTKTSLVLMILFYKSNGISFENQHFREQLAFNTYLIDTLGAVNDYISNANFTNTNQSFNSNQSGSKNEFYISFGSLSKRVVVGGTIGLNMEYTEINTIRETNASGSDEISGLDNTNTTQTYSHRIRINLKLGLIYKLDETIRYGFSIHTYLL